MGSPFAELLFELQVIFDDAVMDHHDIAGTVRMSIGFRRSPMSCPARVADADRSRQRLPAEHRFEVIQLAFASTDCYLAIVQHSDAGGIVAPVLEFSQTV